MKTLENFFTDWESEVFGYGYGTGEHFTIRALMKFFSNLKSDGRSYDYNDMEKALGPDTFWLLLNILCHADMIEYGTSPRYGWLTPECEKLRDFMMDKSYNQLLQLTAQSEDYTHCGSDYCNCDGDICINPFFDKDYQVLRKNNDHRKKPE